MENPLSDDHSGAKLTQRGTDRRLHEHYKVWRFNKWVLEGAPAFCLLLGVWPRR
jgi:hypothetical protein